MSTFDSQDPKYKTPSLSRRHFMAGVAAAGAVASTGGILLPRSAQAAMKPTTGGHFKLGIAGGSTTDSLDPGTYADNYMQSVGHAIHNFLTEITAEGELIGELATKWEASPDARTWTFTLRKGVTFHNGKSLEASDVVASINHHRGEKSSSAAKVIVGPIEELRAEGSYRVVMVLKDGNADFAYLMSDYHLAILPSENGEINPSSGVGCGGYKLESHDPGVRTQVTRNEDYWKKDRAWFDQVTFLSIKDAAARTNALMTGEIHAMNRVELKTAQLLERNPQVQVASIPGGQHYTAPMLTDRTPFNDNNVRQAIKYGIDRQAMLDTVLNGYGQIGNDQPINNTYRYFADLEQTQYDPDQARHYLKKAGIGSLDVSLSAADAAFPGAVDSAVLFREHAAKAGININVVREPDDGYWGDVWQKKPWCLSYWGGKPTEDWVFSVGYASDAAWNDTNWENKRFNELLIRARKEMDEATRRDMYIEMQTLLHKEGGLVLPVFANYVDGIRSNIGHDKLASNWDLDGLRAAERWWFNEA